MEAALVGAATTTSPSFSFAKMLVVVVLLAVGIPLIRKLRKAASKSRKRRWVEAGLMDPPSTDPGAGDRA